MAANMRTSTQRVTVALLPCLVAMCWAAAPKKCPKSELAEIEYSVRTCQKQAEARFFISPDSLRLCQLLVEVSSYRWRSLMIMVMVILLGH